MPQHASAKKRMKTSARSRARNRSVKSHIRRAVGEVQASLGEETAEEQLRRAQSVIDKSA
jgi:ribosomal protein S20